MYATILSNRYLTSRLIPLIGVGAVALCVALVIIVVSVMTGFLDMVKNSGRTLMGDVMVAYPVGGIPHYERFVAQLEAHDDVLAATPVVDGLGVMRMPYDHTEGIQFWGIEPESFRAVTGYAETLHWQTIDDSQRDLLVEQAVIRNWETIFEELSVDQRVAIAQQRIAIVRPELSAEMFDQATEAERRERLDGLSPDFWADALRILTFRTPGLQEILERSQWERLIENDPRIGDPTRVLEEGLALRRTGSDRGGITLGIHIAETNLRERDGSYSQIGSWWMPAYDVTLTTLPIDNDSSSLGDPETLVLEVVNEFISGVYVIDDNRCFISLEDAQYLLHLEEQIRVDPDDPEIELGVIPARATQVLVRAVDGISPDALRETVITAYDAFRDGVLADETLTMAPPPRDFGLSIKTWEQQQAQFIGPVEKERELMRILFMIVYLVCAGLVLAIFWAIVYEKTRDIGILRSFGASRVGIAMIFLRYGTVIGVIGAIVGLGLAWLVTKNIQSIHDALANETPTVLWILTFVCAGAALFVGWWRSRTGLLLPVVLWTLLGFTLTVIAVVLMFHKGTVVWDPAVYYFTEIPNDIDHATAITTMIGAVIFSILGAVIPAAKAADTDPISALRYE